MLLVLTACPLPPQDDGASATTPSMSSVTTTSTSAATGTPTGSSTGDSDGFIARNDAGAGGCDIWMESCPEGQKCMPYSGDGDNAWESLKCVPIAPDPDQLGEPCQVLGSAVSGEDTCDKHLMCWDVDPETGAGTCIDMCIGSPAAPDCADPFTHCVTFNDDVLILCFADCDPIAQDCSHSGDLCIPHPDDRDRFHCVLQSHTGGLFAPCEYINGCDQGHTCADPGLAVECDPTATGCCLPFCDTDEPNTCPGAGQQCVPWYADPADAAPHNVDVGLCSLP